MGLELIKQEKIIAVLRNIKVSDIDHVVKVLNNQDINLLEVTLNSPSALKVIEHIKERYDDVIVGAGTVLDSESARLAILSGAEFIFTPTVDRELIEMTKRYGVVCIPGALTPTEILTAYASGADAVKVFPINSMNKSYVKDLAGPLSHIPIVPTGGIDEENIQYYLDQKNVIAVGVSSSLVNAANLSKEDGISDLERRARKLRSLANQT